MLRGVSPMRLAARLALRGLGKVEPNPLVGCVIVGECGAVLGMGHHRVLGGPHAEVDALASAARLGHDVRGATMFVTLEPCNHSGRTPPCSHAIVRAGIREVVIGAKDPNPIAMGGMKTLRDAGVRVVLCGQTGEDAQARAGDSDRAVSEHADADDARLCQRLLQPFALRLQRARPWVIAKWAQTLDGRVATRTGESKWISGELARDRVHRLRGRVDGVLTGIGTVIADDPMLNARRSVPPRRVATRVVADTDLDVPLDRKVITSARDLPTLVACERSMACTSYSAKKRAALDQAGVTIVPIADNGIGRGIDLRELLGVLHTQHRMSTVMIEAGPGLLGSLIEDDLIDEAIVYIAPLVLGDEQAKSVAIGRVAERLSSARAFDLLRVRPCGQDIEVTYRRRLDPLRV
jgi:diaminohydroxyphosphoribosylaminopyrimidine deaminase/5-amino-6-(5-phosphoribosylamino)uracil reductase